MLVWVPTLAEPRAFEDSDERMLAENDGLIDYQEVVLSTRLSNQASRRLCLRQLGMPLMDIEQQAGKPSGIQNGVQPQFMNANRGRRWSTGRKLFLRSKSRGFRPSLLRSIPMTSRDVARFELDSIRTIGRVMKHPWDRSVENHIIDLSSWMTWIHGWNQAMLTDVPAQKL